MTYHITLSAQATVGTTVSVEAKSQEEAERIALNMAHEGNVLWVYDGCDSDTIEVEG